MIDAIDCYGGEGLVSGLSCGAKIKKKISKKIELGVLKVFLAASVGVARFFGRHNSWTVVGAVMMMCDVGNCYW